MQVCRLLAHLPEEGWETEVITSRECADTRPEIAERGIAALYDRHYTRHEVEPREDIEPSGWLLRKWRQWRPPESIYEANWMGRVAALAARRISASPFDALITFAQPWSDHLIGLRLKKRRPSMPWLAHFSDPWVDSPYYADTSAEVKVAAMAQERAIIEAADRVVFVTRQTADLVMAKYPPAWRDKVRIIPHGFDADIIRQIDTGPALRQGLSDSRRMRIVHTGSLYNGARPVDGLLQALAKLRQSGADMPIELNFVGYNGLVLDQKIKQAGLDDIFLISGPRSWSESLHAAAAADVLLVIDAPAANSVFLPSKLVEYLALRRPVLGLTPEHGASSELLRQLGYPVAPPKDPITIASRLEELLKQWRNGSLGASDQHNQVIAGYDIRHIARQFAALLEEVSAKKRPTSKGARAAVASREPEPNSDSVSPSLPAPERFSALWAAIDSAVGSFQDGQILVVTRHTLPESEIIKLLEHPRISGVVVGKGSQSVSAELAERVGHIDMEAGTWSLPRDLGRLVIFLDHPDNFGVRRAVSALKLGIGSIAIPATYLPVWEKHTTGRLLCRSLFNAVRRRIPRALPASVFAQLVARRKRRLEQGLHRMLADPPLLPPEAFVPGRILLVNSSLGPGGTERQVVNTAIGLRGRDMADISLLCEHLTPGSHDFYAKAVRDVGVMPAERSRVIVGELAHSLEPYGSRLNRIVRRLPIDLSVEVVLYVAELLVRRPMVVHAWQDDTSIKAGLAAAIVGVPSIVLSGRSVAPHHFLFHQPYMRSSYRALCGRPNVVITNNSRAGAHDYESWLGINSGRIKVVHNGFDFDNFRHPGLDAVQAYRTKLGIGPDQAVIGTIMRFSEEKRPLLCVAVAASLLRQKSDLIFLMVGAGVMQAEVFAAVGLLGLRDRIVLVGIERDAALALAAMDVFLLTSRKEGLPNVLVEAQSLGVPVVSTDAGGAAETFQDGVTGRLIRSDEPDRIAAAVLSALDDHEWRKRAIEIAPEFVRRRFSINRMLDDTLRLYGTAAEPPAASAHP
jgi:glycosyltransferase involved in cell wall biosynthesis